MASIVSLAQARSGIEENEIERALTLSLAMSNLEQRARPEHDQTSERISASDTGLREALEASLAYAQEDDSATQRAIELAMKESLKHNESALPDLEGGASVQGSCMEFAIDLASAPSDGNGAFLPQSTAASAPPALRSSADPTWEAPARPGEVFSSGLLLPDLELARPGDVVLPEDVVPAARPFRYDEDFDGPSSSTLGGGVHPSSASAPPTSEPNRGWVCVCAPDEMAHFFAREAFLVPANLRAMAGMAHAGEPLFLLSRFDGLLRGGFEVKPGPQQAHDDGSVSVPFGVAREALVEYAVPLGGSGLLEVLGELTSQSCWELELWQVDAIEGRLEEVAALAHAGEQTPGKADASAGDEEIARALHDEMERERERESKLEADRRARLAAEEHRVAAARREAEAQAQEEAARLEAESEQLRQTEERRREERLRNARQQEEADALRAHELQALEQAQLDYEANERMAQELQDEQQARALHIAMASDHACVPCAPSALSTAVPMGLPVSQPAGGPSRAGPASKLVVIDALNVGRSYNLGFVCPDHHHRFDDRQRSRSTPACATAIALAIEYFLKKGYRVEAFLPEWAYYGGKSGNMFAHEHTLLKKFVDPGPSQSIMLCPSGADDDKWILQNAKEKIEEGWEVIVLSNDMYRDHVASGTVDDAWMKKHAVKFSWMQNNKFFPMLS